MFKKNLIANYFGQGLVSIMGLMLTPIYISYLGIEGYGLIGLYGVISAWLVLLDIGMTPALNREMALFTGGEQSEKSIRNLLRTVEFIVFIIAACVALGLFFGSSLIIHRWLKVESLSLDTVIVAVQYMGVVGALRFIETIYRSSIIGMQRQIFFNYINSTMSAFRGLGSVGVLAWISPTIEVFFIWQTIISFFTVIILAKATYSFMPRSGVIGKFSLFELYRIRKYAGGILTITLLALLLTQIDKLLLSNLLTLSEFGYYSLAVTVSGATYLLIGPITQAIFPRLCELHAKGSEHELIEKYHIGAQLISVIPGSFAIIIFQFSEIFLYLWTGNLELANKVAPLLSLLALGALINTQIHIPYQTQLAYGWTSLAVRINLAAVVLFVPALLWVTPLYGAQGAAWVVILLNVGYLLFWIHLMHRRILMREKWRWYKYDAITPLLCAFLASYIMKEFALEERSYSVDFLIFLCSAFITISAALLGAVNLRYHIMILLKSYIVKGRYLFK